MKHFIKTQQLSRDDIYNIFSLADFYQTRNTDILSGNSVISFFAAESTRTRMSFELATKKLGGNSITILGSQSQEGSIHVPFSSMMKGETFEDTIHVLSQYEGVKAIVLRHPEKNSSQRASRHSLVPIINAGSGAEQHPTQALVDLYTIKKELNHLHGNHIVMVGDLKYGRTIRSLSYLLAKHFEVRISYLSPEELAIKHDLRSYLTEKGADFHEHAITKSNGYLPLIKSADIVYMTRIQREHMKGTATKDYATICMDEELLGHMKNSARLLHPLPHVDEISLSRNIEKKDPRVAYYRQSKNGLPIRSAILDYLTMP